MSNEQQNGADAVTLTPEQAQATWDEVKAERAAQAAGEPVPQPEAVPESPQPAAAHAEPPVAKPSTIEEIQAQMAEMRKEMERSTRNSAGAIGGLKQQLKEQEAALAQARAELERRAAGPTPDQVAAAAKTNAKWDALKSDYPEWAEAIEERFGTTNAKGDQDAIREFERRSAQEFATARAETEAVRRELVESIHPGWRALCKTQEFHDWMEKAGAEERRLADSPLSSDAVKLLNRFKYGADTAPAQQLPPGRTAADLVRDRQQRLATAVTPARGTSGSPSAKSENDMTDAEYWDYIKASKARQQGVR